MAYCCGLVVELIVVWFNERPLWEQVFQSLADFLIVGGVAGELYFERIARVAGDGLQEEARKAVAEANARAAEANQTAEAEKLARLELEKQLAPRTLNFEQINRIAEKLRQFAIGGPRIDLFVDSRSATPDTFLLGTRMTVVLANSGFRFKFWQVIPGPYSRPGITVSNRVGSAAKELKPISLALVDALNAEGLSAIHGPPLGSATEPPGMLEGPTWDANDVAPVRVVVGSKPNPTSNENVIIIQKKK